MAEVKWIKLNVGMFDGNSFKKIKKAKIGGESFRDKLTAVWFELMDFAGKCNAGGQLVESPEIPFSSIEDIAILIDREPEELNLCMQYYISNRMITVIDDVYMLTNWAKYQNEEGLEKIREQTRKRVAKHREQQKLLSGNVTCNVTVTQGNATDIDIERDLEEEKDIIIDSPKKEARHKYGAYNNVLLSDTDLEKLKTEFPDYKERIERLSEYIASTGKSYKNHLATIRSWAKKDVRQAPKSYGTRTAEEKNKGFCFNKDEDSLDDLF
jgi:predicted phage replisome organizer